MSEVNSVFGELVDTLEEQGKSTRAYRSCSALALSQAKEQPEIAAPLLLLAVGARRFLDTYDGEPISAEEVDEAFEAYRSNAEALQNAFASGDVGERLSALNKVAANLV